MGITAENLVTKWGITREQQDALMVESPRWAAQTIVEGRLKSQIVRIVKQTKKGEVIFATDEHVKAGTTMETLVRTLPAAVLIMPRVVFVMAQTPFTGSRRPQKYRSRDPRTRCPHIARASDRSSACGLR
ncbi:thiolase family protein [Paraburkholderia caffeinilytica]|uniref:thiolase family protein n=1 Tax=Paraburkholderia caffeinilytica TaxID=1761016 RepID=UPI0038B79D0F